ncbi:MAG: penicillin amidase, partial [Bacteroidota bacterium]|nr:penicillin amidase [Bacteroidota bacterium]
FFGAGWVDAQDRLWQMDFNRRAGSGRLAEILGKNYIEYDKLMRAIDLNSTVDSLWTITEPKIKNLLASYSEGVNAYIDDYKNKLPFEFGALDYKPEKWKPKDCLILQRLWSFELNISFFADLAMGEIAYKLGIEKTKDLIAVTSLKKPFVFDDTPVETPKSSKPNQKTNDTLSSEISELLDNTSGTLKKIKDVLSIKGSSVGSNSFAVKNSRLRNRVGLLATDFHNTLGLPSKWRQVHISCNTFNVIGLSLPGFPFVLSGRNDNLAWSFINSMIDNCDFFIEQLVPGDTTCYLCDNNKPVKIVYMLDTIEVKNEREVVYYRRFTRNSEILSDFRFYDNSKIKFDPGSSLFKKRNLNKFYLTFKWTGKEKTNEAEFLYHTYLAKSSEDIKNYYQSWGCPSVNYIYADKQGNIGIQLLGLIPNRQEGNPNFPNEGWINSKSWKGYLYGNAFSGIKNPKSDYIIAANNKLISDQSMYLSSYWEPNSRAERFADIYSQYRSYPDYRFSSKEAQYIQLDLGSAYAKEIMKAVVPILEKYSVQMNHEEILIFNKWKNWDCFLYAESGSAAIYTTFIEKMIKNTFHDELGDKLYKEYVSITSIPYRKIKELLIHDNPKLFDNIKTPETEHKEVIVAQSFREAIEYLKKSFHSGNVKDWSYGFLHTITLRHVLSGNNMLKPLIKLGPYKVGGSGTTLNNTEWSLNEPFEAVIGVSARLIADMNDSLIYTIVPGGVSGDPLNKNFSNQLQLWLNGGFIAVPVYPGVSAADKLSVVILPEK